MCEGIAGAPVTGERLPLSKWLRSNSNPDPSALTLWFLRLCELERFTDFRVLVTRGVRGETGSRTTLIVVTAGGSRLALTVIHGHDLYEWVSPSSHPRRAGTCYPYLTDGETESRRCHNPALCYLESLMLHLGWCQDHLGGLENHLYWNPTSGQ